MTYSQILDVINQNIKQNGNEEITGVVLNSVLRALLGFVNDGFITINDVIQILADTKSVNIIGSIGLTTDTTSLPAGVYNTQTSGTYTNASNIVVKEGYYTLLRKLENGNWVLESEVQLNDLSYLEDEINDIRTDNKIVIKNNQLFDEKKFTKDYIDADGTMFSNQNSALTDYIYVKDKSLIYVFAKVLFIYPSYVNFYDENKNKISTAVGVNQYESACILSIPSNAYYVKITIHHPNQDSVFNPNDIFISFTPNIESKEYVSVFEELFKSKTEYTPKLSSGFNLFNGNHLPGYINYENQGGYVISRNGKGAVTDYIYIKGQSKIYTYTNRISGYGLFYNFFDENYNVVKVGEAIGQDSNKGEYDIPSNAVFVRQGISAVNEDRTNFEDFYIGFVPYSPNYKIHQQYGDDKDLGYKVGKINRLPIDDDDAVPYLSIQNKLFNKTYVAIGDSITALERGYTSVVAKNFNMNLINLGSDGAHLVNFQNGTQVDFSHWLVHEELPNAHSNNVIQNQVYKLLRMITATNENVPEVSETTVLYSDYSYPVKGLGSLNKNDVKLITIGAGTNDSTSFMPIGDYNSVKDVSYELLDKKTLYSSLKWCISVLSKYLPNAEIVILTPIQRAVGNDSLIPYVKEEIDASFYFGVPCINQFQNSGIKNLVEKVNYTDTYDGLHPNAKGGLKQGNYVSNELNNLFKY